MKLCRQENESPGGILESEAWQLGLYGPGRHEWNFWSELGLDLGLTIVFLFSFLHQNNKQFNPRWSLSPAFWRLWQWPDSAWRLGPGQHLGGQQVSRPALLKCRKIKTRQVFYIIYCILSWLVDIGFGKMSISVVGLRSSFFCQTFT